MLSHEGTLLVVHGRLKSIVKHRIFLGWVQGRTVMKENEVALQRAEMRMVRWMCNAKAKDKISK